MSFIDSYKKLEKLCNDIYGDNHGVSAYIDEMLSKTNGSYYVSRWNDDLKQLKHYRWVRNQIVHDPSCTEDIMCKPGDTQWLDYFHSRIMSSDDPLALYRKARNSYTPKKLIQTHSPERANYTPPPKSYTPPPTSYTSTEYKKTSSKPSGCFTYLIGALLVIVVMVFIANII